MKKLLVCAVMAMALGFAANSFAKKPKEIRFAYAPTSREGSQYLVQRLTITVTMGGREYSKTVYPTEIFSVPLNGDNVTNLVVRFHGKDGEQHVVSDNAFVPLQESNISIPDFFNLFIERDYQEENLGRIGNILDVGFTHQAIREDKESDSADFAIAILHRAGSYHAVIMPTFDWKEKFPDYTLDEYVGWLNRNNPVPVPSSGGRLD